MFSVGEFACLGGVPDGIIAEKIPVLGVVVIAGVAQQVSEIQLRFARAAE